MSVKIVSGCTVEHVASKTKYLVYKWSNGYYELQNITYRNSGKMNNAARDKTKSEEEMQLLFKSNELRIIKYPQLETNKTQIINL